jgi:hypothetical protein
MYKNFCKKNHLESVNFSEDDFKKDFGILTSFLPQTWLVRDVESKNLKDKDKPAPTGNN